MSGKILEVKGLTKRFGGVIANDQIDMDVYEGELIGLIGPNGAGKTTLFNMICGIKPAGSARAPDEGIIRFLGRDIARLRAHVICRMGLARVFQIVKILKNMSVLDNVAVGALCHCSSFYQAQGEAEEALEFVGLAEKRDSPANDLTITDKKRLEIARAFATRPRLLLLDEVMAGLTSKEVQDAVSLVKQISKAGITIVLIEHVLEAVMAVSQRIIVLNQGRKIADDVPSVVVHDPQVIQAYLGDTPNDA